MYIVEITYFVKRFHFISITISSAHVDFIRLNIWNSNNRAIYVPIANQQLIFDEYRFIWSGIFYVEKLNGKNKQGMIF